ncbi:hypothetical protein QYM36_005714 [Artemia franciscana]|uniref:Uncharacterized protein n=1 Tax=Artemia franciscana TaxID=6661 RepID=A0AA88HWN2_ARTSF|nr:hypothetical protein QYM36_005714 [Artemia franciscana]
MDFEATSVLREPKGDANDLCKETVRQYCKVNSTVRCGSTRNSTNSKDTAGAQSVTEQDINTLGEQIARTKIQDSANVDKQHNDVSEYAAKDDENTQRTTDVCKETIDMTRAQSDTEPNINILSEKMAVTKVQNSENIDEQHNDASQSEAKDGENTERTKRRRRRRKRRNNPACVDSNTEKIPNETGKSNATDGQEAAAREKCRFNNKKKNETPAKGSDLLEEGKPKNVPNQKISVQDQRDQGNLVKPSSLKDVESFLERKRNCPGKGSNLYRGRGGTIRENQGMGYMRGINRGRGQAFHPNRVRGSTYDRDAGRGGSNFNRGRGISDPNKGTGRPDFNRGRGIQNSNYGGGRSEFSRDSERKEFNSGSRRPYFNRGRGRGSSYEVYEGGASYTQITEFTDAKANNFAGRGRRNGEFNRGKANSYRRSVGRKNEGEIRSSDRRQDFQRGRGSSYNRMEEE